MHQYSQYHKHVADFDIIVHDATVKWMYREFGRRLREARRRAGLSQEVLGKSIGLARTSITNIEKGRQHFTLHTAYDLAREVGVPVGSLIPERPFPDAEQAVIPARDRKKYREVMKITGAEEWVNRVIQSGVVKEVTPNEETRANRDGDAKKIQSGKGTGTGRANREKIGGDGSV